MGSSPLSKWSEVRSLTLMYSENLVERIQPFNVVQTVQYLEGLVFTVERGGYPEKKKFNQARPEPWIPQSHQSNGLN